MKKKVGIMTFHRAENYGAVLQAYALQKVINDKYGECEIIDYRDKHIEKPYKMFYIRNMGLKGNIKDIIKSCIFLIPNMKRKRNFKKFYDNIKLSNSIYNVEDINGYDVYITGSDQVWNTDIVGELSDAYTLNFPIKNAKKMSYAASMGKSVIENEQEKEFKNKISQIDKISVREKDAQKLLSNIINKDIEVVLDPTLLLEKDEWNAILKDTYAIPKEKYILAYYVSPEPEFFKITNELSKKTGLKVIHFGVKNRGFNNVYKSAFSEGPLEFLNLIKNAEYVVGTSFHATVFSIIFEKKFFVIPHKKTSSRITNLLNELNIEDRILTSIEEFQAFDYKKDINYKEVKEKLELKRKESLEWLEEAIN